MKKAILSVPFLIVTLLFSTHIIAQEISNPSLQLVNRNSINVFAGFGDYNINYERNILQRPKSYTNLRIGFGKDESYLQGYYISPALVHLLGRKNSHLELDLGLKALIGPLADNGTSFLPVIFAGYRYEKPAGHFIFRVGFEVFTAYNIGIGVKF
jgi:hypothetical protein